MARTVAVLFVKDSKHTSWLGHMPIMKWSLTQLQEVRGIDRIVCVTSQVLSSAVRKLLSEDIEVRVLPKALEKASDSELDTWFTSVEGPAADAEVVLVSLCSSPFLTSGKIEACVAAVRRKKCTHAMPARPVVVAGIRKAVEVQERVNSVRVFRPHVEEDQRKIGTVPVALIESLDVTCPDEYVLVDALVASNKV